MAIVGIDAVTYGVSDLKRQSLLHRFPSLTKNRVTANRAVLMPKMGRKSFLRNAEIRLYLRLFRGAMGSGKSLGVFRAKLI